MEAKYASALRAFERVAWKLDDILLEDAELDFTRPFLPESLVSASSLPFLAEHERRALNHIRAHGYLSTFGLVEEFILPFVIERLRARADEGAELGELRALLSFAAEEAKHITLFRRFQRVFERGFGAHCDVIGPPSVIADHVLAHGELGVGLLILHIEWMTQKHYVEMVHEDATLEASFRRLLHQHWVEESQHARMDGFIVETVAALATPRERARAFEEYVALLAFLDGGLAQQVELDLEAFERVTGRSLSDAERARFRDVQRQSQRRTYLSAGATHPQVRAAIEDIHPAGLPQLRELTRTYL